MEYNPVPIRTSLDLNSASDINQLQANMDHIVNVLIGQILPVGSIIAWHKSLTGTPTLPDNFAECNGQVLSDAESPYHNQTLPNLNGEARFLRGGATSGVNQDDAMQGHWHRAPYLSSTGGIGFRGDANSVGPRISYNDVAINEPVTDGTNGTPRTASETRPKNMSVVYIMRIK